MDPSKRPRLSAARATLKEYGLDVTGIEDVDELLEAFQPIRESYKNQPDGRGEIYDALLRPALLVVRSYLQQVHPRALDRQVSRISVKLP